MLARGSGAAEFNTEEPRNECGAHALEMATLTASEPGYALEAVKAIDTRGEENEISTGEEVLQGFMERDENGRLGR